MNPAYVVNATYLGPLLLPFWFGGLRQKSKGLVEERRKELVGAGAPAEAADQNANEELDGAMPMKVLRVNSHHGWTCWIGDILGAWFVFWIGWTVAGKTVFAHFIAEYVFAVVIGVLVAWHTRVKMMGMPVAQGLLTAARAEVIGITAMLVTLFAWMALIQLWVWEQPLATNSAAFWAINMSPGMILGYLASYPVSAWLLKKGWKMSM
jgi:hypothetical protein